MRWLSDDTIVAIATPLGVGGIGIVRMSGPQALAISTRFISPRSRPKLKPNQVVYTPIRNPTDQRLLDDGCVVYFKAPRSFTGEDVVEFHLHGSVHILETVIKALVQEGARLAHAGEFTRRAFLNGKIDLTKAESVIDVIHANGDLAHAVALNHLNGGLYRRMMAARHDLMQILEQVEGSIDFPDEVDPIDRSEAQQVLDKWINTIQTILDMKDYGKWITAGVKCVIVGRPNAGKSSLMNALLGENRAIVSDMPGTTRDFIEVKLSLGGILFEFVDTAGIRETDNPIEAQGVQRVDDIIRSADLVIWVIDSSCPVSDQDHDIAQRIATQSHRLALLNKSDLPRQFNLDDVDPTLPRLTLSIQTGDGIDALKTKLRQTFVNGIQSVDQDFICNIRQQSCLAQLQQQLIQIRAEMDTAPNDDLFSYDLKQAIQQLGEVTGHTFNEEVLDGIFSRFCVGK